MSFLDSLPQASLRDPFERWATLRRPILEFHELSLRGASTLSAAERGRRR